MENTKILYKYKNIDTKDAYKFLIDSLQNKYFYLSRPNELNDPFDCYIPKQYQYDNEIELEEFVKKANSDPNKPKEINVEYLKHRLETKKYEEFDYMVLNHNHILSLSDSWDIETMWGKYAGNYKGLCIGYIARVQDSRCFLDIDSKLAESLYPTEYRNGIQCLEAVKVEYDNDGSKKFNIFNPDTECILYNIYHKKKIWADESEYRVFIVDNAKENMIDDPDGLLNKIQYKSTVLGEILFGYKMNEYEKHLIYTLIKEAYTTDVKFYEVYPSMEDYKLIRKNYNPKNYYNIQ